jgi:menaquinol-cytochrome c reductase cytochrome b/c subunit
VNEEQKRQYKEKYALAKAKGEKFYPDAVLQDVLISFALFLLLVGLAIFIGVASEPKADPSDAAYIPRPEWYFMFLFQMLKYFPGKLEWVGTFIIPTLAILSLFLLPFFDHNPARHFSKRKFAIAFMTIVMVGIVALTLVAVATTPPQEETSTVAATLPEKITAGQDLYSVNCVECHGADGEGGEIKGVEGLEGFMMKPINSQDEMYTRDDESLAAIIGYGQPDLGMPPFGSTYGGELAPGDIDALVAFMRYTWDDRAELPEEVKQAQAVPALGPDEIPSYEVHVAPLVKRYCLSCHRPGKKNNNYHMSTYEEIMTTGDNAPSDVIPGDPNSIMLRVLNREDLQTLQVPVGPMPPTKALPQNVLDIFTRWILGGAPNTAADAAALAPPASSTPVSSTPTTGTPSVLTPAATP